MRERHVRLAAAPDIAALIRATCRPGEGVIVDCARYATNFLYNQRRPSWRRQTCPRTSRPVMLRLGMMTRCRCQVVGLAGRFNPNVRMLMVVNLIDAMLPHFGSSCPLQAPTHSGHLGAPHRLSRSSPLPRPREIMLTRGVRSRSSRHENHSESGGHSGQRSPGLDVRDNDLVVTAIFLPAMNHHDGCPPVCV
jgi:hypothetical protein